MLATHMDEVGRRDSLQIRRIYVETQRFVDVLIAERQNDQLP